MRRDLRKALLITAGIVLAGAVTGHYGPIEAMRIAAALTAAAIAL